MAKLQQLKINNSKEAAVKSGKWNAPGAAFYDRLLNSYYIEGNKVPDTAEDFQKALNNGKYIQWFQYLEEAYLVAPVKKISNSPHGVTPFSRSGCKYPHHVIRDGQLVVSVPGIKAAYARALQMGVLKGDVKKHLERHIKELGLTTSFKNGALTWNESYEVEIEKNFESIENYISERTGIQFNDPQIEQVSESADKEQLPNIICESLDWIERFVHDDEFRESTIATFRDVCDKCKTPEELLAWMDCINYGWIDKSGKVRGTGDDEDENDFYNEYHLQAPYQLVQSKVGVCWDQTEFERQWFFGKKMMDVDGSKERLIPFFVLYLEIEDGENCPTHTTLIYKQPGETSEVMWFEHAWYDQRGIHKYESLKECLLDILDKFQDSHNDHEHPVMLRKVGLPYKWKDCKTCEEYMDLCRRGMEVDISGPQYDDMFNEYVGIFQTGTFDRYKVSDENLDDAAGDIITEASHGKLKFDFRLGWDYNTGHQMKIVYDLKGAQITDVGDFYPTISGTSKEDYLDYTKKNIVKKGNLDHQSKGQKVLAIVDNVTNEKKMSCRLVNPFCPGINVRQKTQQDIKVMQQEADKNPNFISELKVGEVDPKASYKSTHWFSGSPTDELGGDLRFRQIAKAEIYKDGRGHKIDNLMARDFEVFGQATKYNLFRNPSKKQALTELELRRRDCNAFITHLRKCIRDNDYPDGYDQAKTELLIRGIQKDLVDVITALRKIYAGEDHLNIMKQFRESANDIYDMYSFRDSSDILQEYAEDDLITEGNGSSEYDPPMSYDELPDRLKKDPVHSWRAKTGIELIHREPSYEEFQRIWNNWQLMSDDMKARSDEKSMELFGVNNQTHYEQLLSEYESDLEAQENPPDGTNSKEAYVPIYGIVKSYSSLPVHNDGTPKSDSELGSVRFDKIIHKLTRGDNYSHALVSLDDSLTKMYSYEDEGFVVDNIMERESWLGTKSIYICVMFVKKSDRDRMQKFINYLIDHKQETKYASANLLKAYVSTPYKIDKRFVCSSFTGYILQCSNPKNLHRDYSRLRPEDITILPRSFYVMNVVDRNDFIEKKDQIKAKVQSIFNEFKHEIDDYNNQLPKMMLKQRVDRLKRLDRIMDWIIDRM